MTDDSAVEHKMLLIRNPWGSNGYSWDWNPNDSRWTQTLIDQLPHGYDPNNYNCQDTDNGATDVDGDGCSMYTANPAYCGGYDDDDFTSSTMCCACQGNYDTTGLFVVPLAAFEEGYCFDGY